MSGTHLALLAEGSLIGFPASVKLGYSPQGLEFAGVLRLKDAGLHSLLDFTGSGFAKQVGEQASALLGTVTGDVSIQYSSGIKSLAYSGGIVFAVAGDDSGSALLFRYVHKQKASGSLAEIIGKVAGFFGVSEFFLFFRTSGGIAVSQVSKLLPGRPMSDVDSLTKLKSYDVIARGKFDMEKESTLFTDFMRTLFGIKSADLFAAATRDMTSFETFLLLPDFDTSFVSGNNITVGIGLSGGIPSMSMSGAFYFKFLKMTFMVDCSLGVNRIALSAAAVMANPIPLFGPFKIGTTALSIGFGTEGLSFGFLSTLYVGKLAFFGGVMLSVRSVAIEPKLVVLAVRELDLPLLICNLCEIDCPALDTLKFIQILGFEMNVKTKFPQRLMDGKDVSGIVTHFNNQVQVNSLKLIDGRVETQKYGDGLAFIDQNNLRCYYIEKDGSLKLQAQVYFATVAQPVQMGPYTIHAGIFLCATICIFGVNIKVLFSFVKGSGVLAFAQIDPIKLAGGVLELTASNQKSGADGTTIPLPKNSVLEQFMDKNNTNGLMFFLQADKQNQTFFLSGRLKLFSLFEVDAMVKYEKGDIAINVCFDLAVFRATLNLRVQYSNFQNAGFAFQFILDTSKLDEIIKKVSANIDKAIQRIQQGVASTIRRLDDAQRQVLQLQSEIDCLNCKIDDSRRKIRNARWYQFWIPVAEGAKIAGYGIAIGALYVAMGTATAALTIAKGCVKLGGAIASGALMLVNGIIKAVTSLFFLRRIVLEAAANSSKQRFAASIEFVALGKEYKFSAEYSMGGINQDALADGINGNMQSDLNAMNADSFRANFNRFTPRNLPLPEQIERVSLGMEQLRAARNLMTASHDAYIEEFGALPPDYEEANFKYLEALAEVQNTMAAAKRMQAVSDLDTLLELVESDEAVRSQSASELKAMRNELAHLHTISELLDEAVPEVDTMANTLYDEMQAKRGEAAQTVCDRVAVCEPCDGNMLNVLDKVDAALEENFPFSRRNVNMYINLSRERVFLDGLTQARIEHGGVENPVIASMRSRASRGSSYTERL